MQLIELGKIVRLHGFRGAFVVHCPSGAESALSTLRSLWIGDKRETSRDFQLREANWMPKGWKVQVEGISTEIQAKELIGNSIFADRSEMPNTQLDEYYVTDLVNALVMDQETGQRIGTFLGVEAGPTQQDRWWIKDTEGGELAVPATKRFIAKVENQPDSSTRVIWINHFAELK